VTPASGPDARRGPWQGSRLAPAGGAYCFEREHGDDHARRDRPPDSNRIAHLIVAAIGFAFDIYELLMLPLVLPGALAELGGVQLGSPGSVSETRAVGQSTRIVAGGQPLPSRHPAPSPARARWVLQRGPTEDPSRDVGGAGSRGVSWRDWSPALPQDVVRGRVCAPDRGLQRSFRHQRTVRHLPGGTGGAMCRRLPQARPEARARSWRGCPGRWKSA